MNGSKGGKWILSALSVVLLAFAVGCAKKELVKSTDTASGAAVSTLPPGETQVGQQEPIVTETMKPEETQTAMAGVAATQEKPSDFPDIHFDFDKSFIREDAKPILQEVADYLKASRAASILVEGHCDERGTAEYNIALGERRAESAKTYLLSLGVKAGAVSTISFGEEKPIDPGHDEVAWERNRRAHFVRK
ncbi:MAG: peptidoglycan-associated lipoprotein Pal [Deltaproteobacteria bacterium]|nr:peptidoglycan-associated lipoprotein Pal [Deltaproteobacteria bacterium]MDH3383748.1 peptidoglycan-associated lipoprotein Pal [Deltaproteobacteria bacterium]